MPGKLIGLGAYRLRLAISTGQKARAFGVWLMVDWLEVYRLSSLYDYRAESEGGQTRDPMGTN